MKSYPKVLDPKKVGEYAGLAKSGGGYVWDEVLEYRVWCHPHNGAPDLEEGSDYYYAFDTYEEALECSNDIPGAEEPLALILQREYIDEPSTGQYKHVKEERSQNGQYNFLSGQEEANRLFPILCLLMHQKINWISFVVLLNSNVRKDICISYRHSQVCRGYLSNTFRKAL